jgi:predicted RNA-binding Zn-ribbon protein involved in translation (DUF1610 family)
MANKCISCNNCGHTGWSKNRGNFLITIVLVIFFFVPAIIYEIWRRTGLGVCENCGSDLVVPSNQCQQKNKQFQLDGMGIIIGVVVIGGGLYLLTLLLLVVVAVTKSFIETGNFLPPKSPEKLYELCFADGLKHYQSINQYPLLPDGKTMTMDKIELDCKGSVDGEYPK